MKSTKNVLITGGAGFIGSHLVRYFVTKYPNYHIFNLDALTYAGNLANLKTVENKPNYTFIKGSVTDTNLLTKLFKNHSIDAVIHLAAESHVDRSIENPLTFVNTNVIGTVNLLQAAHLFWKNNKDKLFYHVSTDEVYGALQMDDPKFNENNNYDPHSPYAASKASADHFVRAFFDTYQLPIVISNCSNNYGPNQFPEKLIPLCINNIQKNKTLPIYGNGLNVRDWLYVEDHIEAIDLLFHQGKIGETYNIGGNNEWTNIDLIKYICKLMDGKLKFDKNTANKLITFVKDRAGHDLRYAIDNSKIKAQFNWSPKYTFEQGIEITIDWYLNNEKWLNNVTSGDYKDYYNKMYGF